VWARSWLAWSLAEIGEFDEAVERREEAAEIATGRRPSYSRVQALFGCGVVYVIRGHVDKAISALEEGLVLARVESIPFFAPFITAPLGAALHARGTGGGRGDASGAGDRARRVDAARRQPCDPAHVAR